MKQTMTAIWAYVVAALIYGIFVFTAFAYFGEIALCIRKLIYG